ncbi:acyl-CoA thioesterase, partial [Bacillus haikouensis]|nr:acyl-CoA thioesterase [Bacillus haikouensis]
KVTSEVLLTGETTVAAISFLTFVAIEGGKPVVIPEVVPETEEEKWLNETAKSRAEHRKARKKHSQELAEFFRNAY